MSVTKTVLIIGGSGFIGTHLALKLRDNYKVFATYHKHPLKIQGVTFLPFNVDNRNWSKRIMYMSQPDVVIYAIGNNSYDWAESHPRFSERLHSAGPAIVANSADILQPRFIFLSNPYVFDGTRGNYHENDIVFPNCVLGRTKLGGENIVKSKCLNYLVLRSSPVIGRSNGINHSLLDTLRMKLDRNQQIEVATQELHSFVSVDGFTEVVRRLIETGIRNKIVHYGGLTKMTPFEFAKAFATRFKYNPNLILPKMNMYTHRQSGLAEDFLYDFSVNSTQTSETLKIKPLLLEESFDLIEKQLVTTS